MQDEYEQQQFWLNNDPYKELGITCSNFIKIMYDTSYYKTALTFLTKSVKTKNQIEYKWNINENYGRSIK